MRRGFFYLVAIMDWLSRKVLASRPSNTTDADFYVRDALAIWIEDYNIAAVGSSLGNLPSAAYAKLTVPGTQREGGAALRRGRRAPSSCIIQPTGHK
jgi:hypothetical protein